MKVDLRGKIALVTGAARGIGQAIGAAFAASQAQVIFTDLDLPAAAQAAAPFQNAVALRMDVSDGDEVEKVVTKTLKLFGRLDLLVNNAGVNTLDYRVHIDSFPLEEWDRILKVDLTGVFLVSRIGARPMIQQKWGRIINICSVFGLVPARLQSPFVAAKAGVVNLTKAMALELGPQGVLVNAIAPGSILTDGTKSLFYSSDAKYKERAAKFLAHIPLGRPGTPQEIAQAALFLADPESTYVNGAILTVDGGWTAGYTREF